MARRVIAGLLVALVVALPAAAQTDTATAIGWVSDAQNAALPGATVTARNVATGFTRTAVADGEGRYRIAALPPGRYEFTAELAGFAKNSRQGVTLTLGSESVLNFTMAVSGVAEQITVTAEAPVVETTTATVQASFNRAQIDVLPLIGRDYLSLLRLAPGAQNSNGVSFTGSRGRSNQFTIDGVDNSEDISGYSRQSPAVDSIAEVQVLVNGFKAEYGNASGGLINVITRTGTNGLDGSAFFLFRNQDLMSRNPYADRSLPEDPFQRIHYGGTIGGPIRRDKLHYFATYEREDRDTSTSTTAVYPSAAQIAAASAATRQFLASNGIDPALFGEGGRRRLTRPEFVDVHKATARLDFQASSTQAVTTRFTWDSDNRPSGQGGTLHDFSGSTSFFRTHYGIANHKWILGNNKLNELYVQVGRSKGDFFASQPALPNLTITGGFNLGGPSNYPQGRTDWVYQAVNNFTWNRSGRWGEHVVKAGGQVKVFKSDSFFDSNFRGTYTFPSLAAFLAGRPSRFTRNEGDTTLARPNEIYGLYVQDDWRPTPGLTFNLGLRYDFEAAKTEALRDVTGKPGPGISGDKNNVAPRFGFAWAPGGGTTQSFYGGTGIYNDQVILNIVGNARFTPPKVIGIQVDNPSFPTPPAGGAAASSPNLSVIDPELTTPYNWNSQIGYRRELATNLGVDVSLVYNRGYDHVAILNTNAGRPGTATLTGAGAVRPDPKFTNVSFYTNLGTITYRGLLIDLQKRFSNRFQAEVNYTLSKTTDNSYNFVSGFQVPERMDLSTGPGDDDRRHVVRGNTIVSLPFDVQLGVIMEFRTEAPLDIFAGGRDLNGDGNTGDWVNESICRNSAVNCAGYNFSRNSVRELSTDQANALRALFGLGPIEAFADNPKYFNTDVTLQKRFGFGNQGLRLTVEAFNVFNTPQRELGTNTRTGPRNILSGLFGQYDDVEQPRAVQFTLQVDW